MRERASRLLVFVVLVLGMASIGYFNKGIATAAPQRNIANNVYLPIIPIRSPQPTTDLEVVHMGLYQSVQSQSNDVTLIARKPAILRIYAQASDSIGPIPSARIRVDASRNGQLIGSINSPLQIVSANPMPEDMDSTFNLDLPVDWLSGQLVLTATIDTGDSVPEFSEGNNTLRSTFQFQDVAPLSLTIVPINYVDTVTGKTFTQPGYDPISDWLLSAFPISEIRVNIHAPLNFTGDLRQGEDWGRLLEEVTQVWANEAGQGSSHIYYGLIPNTTSGGDGWFSGGVSGLGWIGQRVSIGLDMGPATATSAAHEIGHNLGRHHAPCGNPSGVDPYFPYANASIGVFGVDTSDETLLDPDSTHDIMSYCGPEWVSDYTYEALFYDQSLRGGQSGVTGEGTFVTTILKDNDSASLGTTDYHRLATGLLADSPYQVQLVDRDGQTIATYPAELYTAEETGVRVAMLAAFIPDTNGANAEIAKLRFTSGSVVLTEKVVAERPASE